MIRGDAQPPDTYYIGMTDADQKKPELPAGARLLNVGDIIQDGDLHWQPAVKHWVAVTPQGEEKVEPGQYGFYCRKDSDD